MHFIMCLPIYGAVAQKHAPARNIASLSLRNEEFSFANVLRRNGGFGAMRDL
jgi:hypothetical protein